MTIKIKYDRLKVSKTKEYKMETIKQILNNEVKKHIKRPPTVQEFHKLMEYIAESIDDKTDIKGIADLVEGWVASDMVKCQWCGAWGLISEMEEENGYYFCDNECLVEANEGFDMHAEAKAEYVALNR